MMAARTIRSILLGATALLAVPACSGEKKAAPDAAEIAGAVDIAAESARLNEWFSARWLEELERSPEMRTFLGDKTDYDKLDDVSDEQLELRLIELKIHRWCEPALRRRGV